jgi:hypothetical protein
MDTKGKPKSLAVSNKINIFAKVYKYWNKC